MSTPNKVSKLVPQQVPEFVHEYGPDLIRFLQAYYEWMEQDRNPIDLRHNFLDYNDIDRTLDEFVDLFHDEFMRSLPKNIAADRRLVLKHIREQLYRAKGTERGMRFLFRILYNEHVSFYYPGQDMLRASDGKWQIDRSLRVGALLVDPAVLNCYTGKYIKGNHSGAVAMVERIDTKVVSSVNVYDLYLRVLKGTFSNQETISDYDTGVSLFESSSYTVHEGRYLNTDGFLSSNKYLQDNYYYQEFSYVIKSGQPITRYKTIIERLTHPAGTLMFGEFQALSVLRSVRPNISSNKSETNLTYTTISANLAPLVFGSVAYGSSDDDGLSGTLTMLTEIENNDMSVESYITKSAPASNFYRVASSQTLADYSGYTIADFAGWSLADFTTGRGFICDANTVMDDLDVGETFHVVDNDGSDANSFNEVQVVSSQRAFKARFAYPYGDLANGSLIVNQTV